jgi:hypothetical protein
LALPRGLCLLALLLAVPLLPAQETEGDVPQGQQEPESPLQELIPRFKDRAVVLDIIARVVEQNQSVVWNESHQKVTISGRPVGLKLVGANVVVAVQFTPYFRRKGQKLLVAQGQIWMDVPGQGIRYHTSIQTIPLEFNEPIYFFPLGSAPPENQACIEVLLTIKPYLDDTPLAGEGGAPANVPAPKDGQ